MTWDLYVIADLGAGRHSVGLVRDALPAGCGMVQLRAKSRPAELSQIASGLRRLVHGSGGRLIVNDDPALARACRSDGVHLGQGDRPWEVLARRSGMSLVGVSVSTLEEAKQAWEAGADYLGVGPVYGTQSKPDARPALGLEPLARIAEAVPVPVIAIGGIGPENAREAARAGAAGVAVISALTGAVDRAAVCHRLIAEVRKGKRERGMA